MAIIFNSTLTCQNVTYNLSISSNATTENNYLQNAQIISNYISTVLILIAAPIIVTGNVLVIVSVAKFRHLQSVMNLFVTSLAFADMLVGVPTIPLYAVVYLNSGSIHHKYMCLIKYGFVLISCGASILNLLLVTLDRFIAIVYPLHYHSIMTKRRAKCLIAAVWVYVTAVALLPILGVNTWDDNTNNVCDFFKILPFALSLISSNILTLVSLPTVIAMYVKIFMEAAANNRRLNKLQFNRQGQGKILRQDTSMAKMMAFVSLVFFIFWFPFTISSLLKHTRINPVIIDIIKNLSMTFAMFNSLVNPLIYCWMRQEFRTAFQKLLQMMRSCCVARVATDPPPTTKCHIVSLHKNVNVPGNLQ